MKASPKIYFILFAVSGFSGLIYESIWSHYLKLFLGHAAYAQTLVLVIFMGGLALGAWLAGQHSYRIGNLLLGYALAEGLIGLLALSFHPLFVQITDFAYSQIMAGLEAVWMVQLLKWSLAACLILPQSILLGTTFPLLSAGLLRRFPHLPGHSLAILYFTNSLGAALGVLVSGFILIEAVGLPGTLLVAGLLNLSIALIVWLLCRTHPPLTHQVPQVRPARLRLVILGGAMLTGISSFLYEIGWIRMLSLVLGSSTHAFELMLSAFILGLALGGFWIKQRLDTLDNHIKILGLIQILMGLFALATLPIYGKTFNLMSYLLTALNNNEPGYVLFNLFSHGIALLVMLPATICAGMTLPILTYYLLAQQQGERVIGQVYAANTLGAILGITLGVQWIMPELGVKHLITIGAGIDLGLGFGLLLYACFSKWNWLLVTGSLMIWMVSLWTPLDSVKMASGVFRNGNLATQTEVLFHRDGKTASVDLYRRHDALIISTNGKPDASIGEGATPSNDESTMVMLGALPYAIHPQAKTVANIGLGSGLTTQVLLTIPTLARVDTIEIEPAMIEGAQGFGRRVERTFKDPRSHLYVEDARTFFSQRSTRYDLIISEPSNPWVSGVAGLFSQEFYQKIVKHLQEDGLFVQWTQLYEINTPLIASIIKALSAHFEDYVVYHFVPDLLIVAKQRGKLAAPSDQIFTIPELATELQRVGITNLQDLASHRIGSKRMLDPLFHSYEVPANSDYYPILDLAAVRARYLKEQAFELVNLTSLATPFMEMLGEPPTTKANPEARAIFQSLLAAKSPPPPMSDDTWLLIRSVQSLIRQTCPTGSWGSVEIEKAWLPFLKILANQTLPYLSITEMATLWTAIESFPCSSYLPPGARNWFNLYKAVSNRNLEAMLQLASTLLPASDPADQNYLLTVALVAQLALKHPQEALALWQRYVIPSHSLSLELRLLGTLTLQATKNKSGHFN